MNLKTVMDPKTRLIITIDADEDADWQSHYLHRNTGQPFDGFDLVAKSEDVVEEETTPSIVTEQPTEEVVEKPSEEMESMNMEELRALYTTVTGKNLSPRFKDDREWITSKLA